MEKRNPVTQRKAGPGSILIKSKLILSPVIILSIFFMPLFTYAATFYRCFGKAGDISITDYPIDGKACKPVGTFKEMTDEEKMKDKREGEDKEKNGPKNTKKESLPMP